MQGESPRSTIYKVASYFISNKAKFSLGILSCIFSLSGSVIAQNVWTQHNDQARTGWYPFETMLNTSTVNQNNFGISFTHQTDDFIFGQPLVVFNVNIPNKGFKNIVLVTTLNNSVYAFDADVNSDVYWVQNYSKKIAPLPALDCISCRTAVASDIHPDLCNGTFQGGTGNLGIVGTAVIDTLAGTMFFITKIVNPTEAGYDNHNWNDPNFTGPYKEYAYTSIGFHQYLHAIDIATGEERPNSPTEIIPAVTGTGDGQTSSGIITFNPRTQFNRAGLVLSNGKVYIAFAAHCDNNPSHGWIVSYDSKTLALADAYVSTPNDGRGGIWMSGGAPAVDEAGNIYFSSGNGLNEIPTSNDDENRIHLFTNALASDPVNRGESVVKLTPDLKIASYFTPFNYIALNDADKDFTTQVMLIPNTNLSIAGCKDGNIYLMDRTNLGGFDANFNNIQQLISLPSGALMHSNFAYFGGATPTVYQYSEKSHLTSFQVNNRNLSSGTINSNILEPTGYTGAFLSVSSNGIDPATSILWAYQPQNACSGNCHGILRAINAVDITKELWNSDMSAPDQIYFFNKFSVPSIANGKVYITANRNTLLSYGLKSNNNCANNLAINTPISVSSTGAGNTSYAVDGDLTTSWVSGNQDADYIFLDLGNGSSSRFELCRISISWVGNQYPKDFDLKISDDGISWTTIKSFRGNNSNYTEFNNGVTARYVRMEGITRNGSNPYGISEFQVFGQPASACRAPGNLAAATIAQNTEHLSWDAVSGADTYIIKYRNALSQDWLTRTAATNSIDIMALSCGAIYNYTVQANCGAVPGDSSVGSFTLSGCDPSGCDNLPAGYHNLDLGDVGVAGSTCKNGNLYTLTGSGADIGGNADQFQFAYTRDDNSDHEALGHLVQQDDVFTSNKLGIMVRDSMTCSSRFAIIASVNNGSNFIFEYRDIAGGPVYATNLPGTYTVPVWLKIAKTGTNYTGYISSDNISWNQLGASVDLQFGNDPANVPQYGMAITSANNAGLSTGKIQDFSFNASGSTPLPVRLLNFSAKGVNHDHVLVSWATSMEHLADYFLVQRSLDGKGFQSVERVNAVGESETEQHYSVNDNKPVPGIMYYRLQEVDKDGKFYFSPIVSVKFDAPNGFEMFPNPAGDFTNISSLRDPITDVKLFDITGKLLQNVHSEKQIAVQLNTSSLPKGIYFVSVKTTTGMYRQKLIRQ